MVTADDLHPLDAQAMQDAVSERDRHKEGGNVSLNLAFPFNGPAVNVTFTPIGGDCAHLSCRCVCSAKNAWHSAGRLGTC